VVLNSIPTHTTLPKAEPLQWVSLNESKAWTGSAPGSKDVAMGYPMDVSTLELAEQSGEEYSSIHWTVHHPTVSKVADCGADSRHALAVVIEGSSLGM
jgi:hypothetical protein